MYETVLLHGDRCCSPYGLAGHKGKYLRLLSKSLLRQFPLLPPTAKICWNCRRNKKSLDSAHSESYSNVSGNSQGHIDTSHDSSINTCFNSFDLDAAPAPSTEAIILRSKREMELEEILNGLKEKLASLSTNDKQKLSILTIAPRSWSPQKIAREFGWSWQLAKKAKDIRASQGILENTTVKSGRELPKVTFENFIDFDVNDANSRIMPRKKDVISVVSSEGYCLIQKRLLLMDLRELYVTYKEKHADSPVSFSKFSQLRPKYCVLAFQWNTLRLRLYYPSEL